MTAAPELSVVTVEDILEQSTLVLWNDEVNTIDDIILALRMVMDFGQEQAEQLALLAHHRGKYPIKKGDLVLLMDYYELLSQYGLTMEIV